MSQDLLSISDFAIYARTTRDTLLYYDQLGLLSPVARGKNNYRYYSVTQVGIVNLIRILQQLGMTLTAIKALKDTRTPLVMKDILIQQIDEIDKTVNGWIQARKLLHTTIDIIQDALDIDETAIYRRFMPARAIILGDLNDYSNDRSDYDALTDFYDLTLAKYPDLDMNYPVWGVFSKQQLLQKDYAWPERYYFYNPEGFDKKPAGDYVIGHVRGAYGHSDELFERLLGYINSNSLEICGDSYKEYLLNELCIPDENNYLIRIMIPVKDK